MSDSVALPDLNEPSRLSLTYFWSSLLETCSRRIERVRAWRAEKLTNQRDKAIEAYESGQALRAVNLLFTAIVSNPRDPELRCDLGQIYYENSQYASAESQYRRALRISHDNLRALKGLAYSLQAQSKDSESIYYFLRLLQHDATNVDIIINLGAAFQNSGDFKAALDYYDRAEKLDPKNPVVPENRGRALYAMGRIDDALACAKHSLELEPQNMEARVLLASLLQSSEKYEEALRIYLDIINDNADSGDIWLNASITLVHLQRDEEAVEYARKAALLFEKDGNKDGLASAYWNLGWSNYRANDIESAIKNSRKAVNLNPGLVAARFNLALALLHANNVGEACREYKIGAEAIKMASELQFWAIDDLEDALSRNPNLPGGPEALRILREKYKAMRQERGLTSPRQRT
jgi:tetratricopeptide (TPR) repeat protein